MAENEKTAQEETQEKAEPKHAKRGTVKGPPKLLVIILLAIVLGGGGFFGFKIMGAKRSGKPAVLKVGETVQLEEFLVNLADGKTFLKLTVALGLAEGAHLSEDAGHAEEQPEPPAVRDAIIMLLTSKKPSDISTPEGKETLKREIISKLNQILSNSHGGHKEAGDSANKPTESPGHKTGTGQQQEEPNRGPVLEVYFTSFATQKY